MNENTGFHEHKDGKRYNPDCPKCQRDGADTLFSSLEQLARERDKAREELEYILSLANIPKRIV